MNRGGRGGGSRAWRAIRKQVLERDMHVCQYCGAEGANTVDHVVAWIHGGPDTLDNLVTACATCNRRKGTGPGFWTRPATSPTPLGSLSPRGTTTHRSWA